MANYHQRVWITCLVEGLIMVASAGIAGAADCGRAIDKAIAQWIEQEPNWLDPEAAARPSNMGYGPYLQNADQRTRIALGRPIAKALATACGKSNVKALQERVENAPELIRKRQEINSACRSPDTAAGLGREPTEQDGGKTGDMALRPPGFPQSHVEKRSVFARTGKRLTIRDGL